MRTCIASGSGTGGSSARLTNGSMVSSRIDCQFVASRGSRMEKVEAASCRWMPKNVLRSYVFW